LSYKKNLIICLALDFVKINLILLFVKKQKQRTNIENKWKIKAFSKLTTLFWEKNPWDLFLICIVMIIIWKLYVSIQNFIFFIFISLSLMKKKELLNSRKGKWKSLFVYILVTKLVHGINKFHSTRKILWIYFFIFNLARKKIDQIEKKIKF